jgi:hypothetical protein
MSDENNVPSAGADAGATVLETAETVNAETAVEDASIAEAEASDDSEESDQGQPKKKPSGSARLRERLDREIAQRAAAEERLRSFMDQQRLAPVSTDAPPKEEDFNGDYFAWLSAKTVWEAEQRMSPKIRELEERLMGRDQASVQRDIAKGFSEREAEARKAIPDYDDVMAEADQIPASDAMLDVIRASDRGPALAYHLAKNPELSLKIANMPPLLAAKELGRIEASISPAKPRTESKAPAPIQAIKARSQVNTSPEDMDMAQYHAAYLKRNSR